MKHYLFAALGFGLCVALLTAAAPPSVMKLAAEAEADDDDGVQDILYVGQPHPVMLRLKLKVEGKSAFTHYDACMAKYFEHLDRNNNKTLDRNEAAKAPSAQMMLQFFQGNPFVSLQRRPNTAAVPFEEFDADRDGKVTLDEFKEYYAKNGAGPILMTAGANAYNPYGNASDATSDVVFNLLDADKDGKLSKEEIDNAEKVLLKYDADDNELVTMAELNLLAQSANLRRIAEVRRRQPMTPTVATNMILMSREDSGKRKASRTALVRELIAKYDKDKDGALSREEIGFSKKLFDSLDRNKDGKLSVLELVKWVDGKPAGDFTVAMRDQGGAMARRTTAMRQPATRQEEMLVSLGSVRIKIVPQSGVVYGRITEDVLLQQFRALDNEKKGFITRKQVEGNSAQANFFRGLFDMADRNSDAKVTEAELKALMASITAMRGIQLSLSIFSTGNGLFQTLDTNGDGRLSLRELRHAAKHLADLDVNKDGYISRDEFPQQFQLTVNQGGNVGILPPQVGMGGPEPVRQRVRGPVWFVKMDRNGDGDVSRSEWLGSREDFDAIDTDKDGLISLEEAEAYDVKMRNKANDD